MFGSLGFTELILILMIVLLLLQGNYRNSEGSRDQGFKSP